ncbi:hypothetical protein [Flavobacterium sp. Root186]|nr:hypothetical protein [Flavobacterium sp. Root186]
MKLTSLKNVEVINEEIAELVNGGIVPPDSTSGDVYSTSGDSVHHD